MSSANASARMSSSSASVSSGMTFENRCPPAPPILPLLFLYSGHSSWSDGRGRVGFLDSTLSRSRNS